MAKFALVAASSWAAVIWAPAARGDGRWQVGVLLAGDSDLWQLSRRIYRSLAQTPPAMDMLVLLDGPAGVGESRMMWVKNGLVREKPAAGWDTGSCKALAQLVRGMGPGDGRFRLLGLVGHGRPIALKSGKVAGGFLADWGSDDALTPREMAEGLGVSRWDLVVLFGCHTASLEMLQALQGRAKYVVAGAGEFMAGGEGFVAGMRALPGAATARQAAVEFGRRLSRDMRPEGHGMCAVVVVDMAEIGEAIDALGEMARAVRGEREVWQYALADALVAAPVLDESGTVVDVGALCTALAKLLPANEGGMAASRAAEAMKKAIVWSKWMGGKPAGAVGVEITIPSAQVLRAENAAEEVPLWKKIGWIYLAGEEGRKSSQTGGCSLMWASTYQAETGGGS